ncbi:hypothetical protein Droror1_Dr00014920 [Drosera rotundifolia]
MAMESSEFPELDRISSLPDEIIARILSFLPTMKHAFMTSILSRRWQYLQYCLTDELDIEVEITSPGKYLFEPYLVNRIFADSLLLESARIVECSWRKGDALYLCSKALESLVMKRCYGSNLERIKAVIDAPSLLEFKFGGRSYMVDYTFKNFDSLDVVTLALEDYVEEDFGSQMDFLRNLISAVAKTRHLHLSGFCMPVIIL